MDIVLPIAEPIATSFSGSLAGGGAGNLAPPTGFDWSPPIGIYRSGSSFGTNFNANDWKVAATASLYVSPTGNDTTGNGSEALPFRTIKKGLSSAALLADAAVNIFVATGTYDRNQHWNGTACDKHLNVIAVGGPVISSTRFEALSWTLHATGVYKATRSTVATVWDDAFIDGDGVAQKLVKKALLADCVSTPTTWHTDGTTLYVHTTDGREPDSNVLVMASVANAVFAYNKTWYIEGITFEGGSGNPFGCTSSTIDAAAQLIFNGGTARYSADTFNGYAISGVPLSILNDCDAYGNDADGFNYHVGSNAIDPKVMEIACRGFKNGLTDGTNNDNGSTAHEASRIVRVSCEYFANVGPQVTDVNTSQSWNLGVNAHDSASTASDATDSGFRTLDTAAMWLDTCAASGSTNAAVTDGTSNIKYRNGTFSGALSGNVTTY